MSEKKFIVYKKNREGQWLHFKTYPWYPEALLDLEDFYTHYKIEEHGESSQTMTSQDFDEYILKVKRDLDAGNFDIPKFMSKLLGIIETQKQQHQQDRAKIESLEGQLDIMLRQFDLKQATIAKLTSALEKIEKGTKQAQDYIDSEPITVDLAWHEFVEIAEAALKSEGM
jgi:hypothetical protein